MNKLSHQQLLCNSKNTFLIASALLYGYFCFGQNQAVQGTHGVWRCKSDSTDLANTIIFHYDSAEVIIFPASYTLKKNGRFSKYENRQFITADTALVKEALAQLNLQYCSALINFQKMSFQERINRNKETIKDTRKIKRQQRKTIAQFKKSCPKSQLLLKLIDKQVIAYKNRSGDTILYIQTLDFRQDPINLKPYSRKEWIDGWHGWFETNTRIFHYHKKNKLVTINENF